MCCEPHLCPSLASSYPQEILYYKYYYKHVNPGILILSVPLRTCSPDWLGRRKGAGHTKTHSPAASRSSFPLSYMFGAATVLCCTNHKVSLAYSHFPAPIRLSFLSSRFRCVCRSSSGKSFWSHHRHVDYTRATLGPLHTFVSSASIVFFSSPKLYFLAETGVVFGIRKILNNRRKPADFRSLLLPTRPLIQTGPGC
ncbi:hypothetical protein V8C34DRAFT_277924 [Trichoderma compactum]